MLENLSVFTSHWLKWHRPGFLQSTSATTVGRRSETTRNDFLERWYHEEDTVKYKKKGRKAVAHAELKC